MPGNYFARAGGKWNGCDEIRHNLLDLAIIEDRAVGLVSQQAVANSPVIRGNQIGRDVDEIRGYTGSFRQELIDAVPGEPFIRGDVEDLPARPIVPQQPHKPFSKISAVRECPNGSAIAMNHNRFSAQHSIDHRVTTLNRYIRPVIGVGGSHNGKGKLRAPVFVEKKFFASDLVARVFPNAVLQWR